MYINVKYSKLIFTIDRTEKIHYATSSLLSHVIISCYVTSKRNFILYTVLCDIE